MTSGDVLAFRRPRLLHGALQAGEIGSIAVARGLRPVLLQSIRSHRYAAAAAALASIGSRPPLSVKATLKGQPVGWALAHGRSWRFPFMAADDLQFGLVFVESEHRRTGVGSQLVAYMANASEAPIGNFWWFCRQSNVESISLAERAGFAMVGRLQRLDTLRGYRLQPKARP